jgi:hypothetical protein
MLEKQITSLEQQVYELEKALGRGEFNASHTKVSYSLFYNIYIYIYIYYIFIIQHLDIFYRFYNSKTIQVQEQMKLAGKSYKLYAQKIKLCVNL